MDMNIEQNQGRMVQVRVTMPYATRKKVRQWAANHDMNTNDAAVDMLNKAEEREDNHV